MKIFLFLACLFASGLTAQAATNQIAEPAKTGTLLLSKEGSRYVGEQFQFFLVDEEDVITATNSAWISLYYTEGKSFRLTGEVRMKEVLTRYQVGDMPDGFALFLREFDSLHRYSLTTRTMEVKRRLRGGILDNRFAILTVGSFTPPEARVWIPFTVEASAEKIVFQIGKQTGTIPGPVDMDGANKICLAPGTMLRNLRLELTGPKAK